MNAAARAAQLEALLTHALSAGPVATDADNIHRRVSAAVGATSPSDMTGLVREDLDELDTTRAILNAAGGAHVILTLAQKKRILGLDHFVNDRDDADWTTVTEIECEEWRIEHPGLTGPVPRQIGPPPPTAAEISDAVALALPAPQAPTADEIWERKMKRSPEDCGILKQKSQWAHWHRELRATGQLHDIDAVFDGAHVPAAGDAAVFEAKKKLAFAVFTRCLKETSAAEIVRQCSNPQRANCGDSQELHQRLRALMEEGVQSTLSMQDLERKIGDMKLDASWTKTVAAFVNALARLVSDHKSADKNDTCDDEWCVTRFKTALNCDNEFRSHFSTHDANRVSLESVARAGHLPLPAAETHVEFLQRIQSQALVVDNANKQVGAARTQQANSLKRNQENNQTSTSPSQSGGRGGQGRGGRGGHGNGGRGSGRGGRGGSSG